MILFHELSHWTAHPERMFRDSENPKNYVEEETVAEIVSAFLCYRFKITLLIDHYIEYISFIFSKRNIEAPIPETYFKKAEEIVEYLLSLPGNKN